jgi:hypothetical protein
MPLTLDGTNGITQSTSFKSNTYLDAAGGNTATINGTLIPASGVTLVSTAATQTLTNKTIASSQLTGALPAIDGSALTGIASMTLLGTLTTTSGSTVTLSGLTLTSYQQVVAVFKGVSQTAANTIQFSSLNINTAPTASNAVWGILTVDLTTGIWVFPNTNALVAGENNSNGSVPAWFAGIQNTLTTSSTSISFSIASGTFDSGSIRIYGVK